MTRRVPIAIATIAIAAIAVAGCSSHASPSKSQPSPSSKGPLGSLSKDSATSDTPELFKFGQSHTYVDGVKLSVSEPYAFHPSDAAAMDTSLGHNVAVKVTVTNDSKEILQPSATPAMQGGGKDGSEIFDTGTESSPNSAILPGHSITWVDAWSVAGTADLQYQTEPSDDYVTLIFTD